MTSPLASRLLSVALGLCSFLALGGCAPAARQGGDAEKARPESPEPSSPLTGKELAALWDDLASDDGPRAYQALGRFVLHPREGAPFLKKQLRPAPDPDRRETARLIAALDADAFADREKAQQGLEALGGLALTPVNRALEARPSPEARRRLEELRGKLEGRIPPGEEMREVRAVEALERIGTAEAREVLAGLAKGAAEAWLTQEAKASLDRLERAASPRR
jgi:hypothetical protein